MSFVDIFVAIKDVCKNSDIEATTDVEGVMVSTNNIVLQNLYPVWSTKIDTGILYLACVYHRSYLNIGNVYMSVWPTLHPRFY